MHDEECTSRVQGISAWAPRWQTFTIVYFDDPEGPEGNPLNAFGTVANTDPMTSLRIMGVNDTSLNEHYRLSPSLHPPPFGSAATGPRRLGRSEDRALEIAEKEHGHPWPVHIHTPSPPPPFPLLSPRVPCPPPQGPCPVSIILATVRGHILLTGARLENIFDSEKWHARN